MKFKVGDRIICFNAGVNGELREIRGTVVSIRPTGALHIEYGNPNVWWIAHPKECRLLKPAKVRRRIWVPLRNSSALPSNVLNSSNHLNDYLDERPSDTKLNSFTEFREVRRPK